MNAAKLKPLKSRPSVPVQAGWSNSSSTGSIRWIRLNGKGDKTLASNRDFRFRPAAKYKKAVSIPVASYIQS